MKAYSSHIRSIGFALAIASGALVLHGCATQQQGGEKTAEKSSESAPDYSFIVHGKTTKAQLVAKLGSPTETIVSKNGDTMVWGESTLKINPMTYIPFVGMFKGGSKTSTKELTVHLNKRGIVTDHTYSVGEREDKLGM